MATAAAGHGYLGSELPSSSTFSQPRAADQVKSRDDLSSKTTFRLHILENRDWDKSQIDGARVKNLIRKAFDVTPNTEIIIKSLTGHHVRDALVATLNFSQIPPKIAKTSPSLQEFCETVEGLSLILDTHFHGFTPLHSKTSSEYSCDFIALSGLGGHAFGSFKSRGSDFMWLRDDLPYSIPNARIFIYGYDTRLQGSTSLQSLEDLGLSFKDALLSLLGESLKSNRMKPLVLLGHSLGGLVVKEALCQMSTIPKVHEELLKHIRAILFFGTPNQGMDIRSLIPMVQDQVNENFLRSLGTDSTDLRRQAQQWSRAFDDVESNTFSKGRLEITSYYETSTSRTAIGVDGSWKMSGPPVILVDKSSATHGRPWERDERFVQPIDRDHSALVKFRNRTDPVYVEHVLPRLKSYLDDNAHELQQSDFNEKKEACLLSLDFPERVSRQDQIITARENTCKWLLEHQTYRTWIQQGQDLLWLEGHPGSGKSTLTKYAMETISDNASSKTAVFAHFFHGRGSEMQKSALGLLRSLAFQLIENFPAHGTDFVKKHNGMDPFTWKLEWLYSALENNLLKACRSRPIIIFIDALDECNEDDRDSLGDFLTRIVRGPVGANLKVFVSCRHYPNLFSEGCRVQTEINNADDIAIFVSSKLQIMKEKKGSVLAKEIISNARGNFQWAHIVTRQSITLHRKGRTAANIQENIRQLPKDIHELYDSLFKDADAEDLQLAHRLFHWLCFAKQPLSIREVQYIIMLSPDTKERSIEEICRRTDFREELDDMVNTITDISRGLAEILVHENSVYSSQNANQREMTHSVPSWSSKVQLIHQTVRDYLLDTGLDHMNRGRQEKGASSSEKAGHYILRSCLRYVMMDDFVDQDELESPKGKTALHPYIFQFFKHHLIEAESGATHQSELIETLGWPHNRANLTKLAIALCMRPYWETFDDRPLPSVFFEEYGPARYFNLLLWAAKKGLAGVVKSIARRRFDQGQEELHPGCAPSSTVPLSISTWEPQSMFIDGYYNINVEDCSGWWTALRGAILKGHVSVVCELMRSPVIDPNVQDPLGRTPLHDANSDWVHLGPSKDRHQIVKILLDHPRINATLRDRTGKTALFDAVDGNDMEILKMNVNASNTCINMTDICGNTPLSQAAMHGYVDAVKLLISCGNCTEATLQHAYRVAQSKRHVKVQEAILSNERTHHGARIGHAEPVEDNAAFFRACGTFKLPSLRKPEEGCVDLANIGSWMNDEEIRLSLMSVNSWMDDDIDPLHVGSWMRNEEGIDFLYASSWTRYQISTDLMHALLLVDNQQKPVGSMVCEQSISRDGEDPIGDWEKWEEYLEEPKIDWKDWEEMTRDWEEPTETCSLSPINTQPEPKRRRLG